MSLVKLTSLSTQTLSLLLERQRLQSISQFQGPTAQQRTSNLHLPQIIRNLNQLRTGILELEAKNGAGTAEAAGLLRNQYGRMIGMLGGDAESLGIESLDGEPTPASLHAPSPSPGPTSSRSPPPKDSEPVYSPYTDDPEAQGGYDPNAMLQTQKQMIDEQDTQLSHLSSSLNRQHHLSLAINSELEEHHGLLEELDTDLEGTRSRLGGARRRLDRVAKGVKGNGSTVTIALLILVLLILIIVFKT
ncbi:hypothetical protein PILCRDRAFT_635079 [Piloderma croceum F 1598]|uniref:t-SNARE coiled-coil homology domain-containing protein n=1 Tax=Piloderma croceum (strain F 1598) TaxID=765440 RepID=A0A0C3FB11_PILCF|nr:hypothetical protein PILCRDRAFT_635079 [Piloderma croceum F 1598]